MRENELENNSEKSKIKRIASLDFQRGLAIWLMVFLHVWNHIYDFSWIDLGTIFQEANFFFGVWVVFCGFFGGWAGYFLLISSTVNSLASVKRVRKSNNAEQVLFKQFLTGVGVLIAGRLTEALGYYGYFGRVFRSGNSLFSINTWKDHYALSFIWRRIFMMEALQIIGWCMIINAFIQYFLIRKGGSEKTLRNMIIYASLTIIILVATPFIWKAVENMHWYVPSDQYVAANYPEYSSAYHKTWPSEFLQAENASLRTYFLVLLSGDIYPLFPFLSTSFIGSIIGLALGMKKPPKRLPLWIFIGTIVITATGFIVGLFMFWEPNFDRPYFPYYFMLLGGQMLIMDLFLWLVEYRGKGDKFAQNIVVKYFRIWGMVALSIFALQIWSIAPRFVFNFAFKNINLLNERFGRGQEGWVFLFSFITILFYDAIIWTWARINFKFGFEWFIIRLASLGSKDVSRRLNFKEMLNNVEWLNYKELSRS